MKNKFENDFIETRDSWWSILDQIEKQTHPIITQEIRNIIELSLYNQRDMLLELDKLRLEIAKQNKPQTQKTFEKAKKRQVRFPDNPLLEKIDYFLYRLKK